MLSPPPSSERPNLANAAEVPDFKVEVARVSASPNVGDGWAGATIAEHALVPCRAGQPVSRLARRSGAFGRRPDRAAVNRSRDLVPWRRNAPGRSGKTLQIVHCG